MASNINGKKIESMVSNGYLITSYGNFFSVSVSGECSLPIERWEASCSGLNIDFSDVQKSSFRNFLIMVNLEPPININVGQVGTATGLTAYSTKNNKILGLVKDLVRLTGFIPSNPDWEDKKISRDNIDSRFYDQITRISVKEGIPEEFVFGNLSFRRFVNLYKKDDNTTTSLRAQQLYGFPVYRFN